MGYYSDVALVVCAENKEQLQQLVEQLKGLKISRDGEVKAFENDLTIGAEWWSIKWYDYFEDIKQFYNWLDDLENKGIGFHFMRIGEDYCDVEEKYENNPRRYIEFCRSIKAI